MNWCTGALALASLAGIITITGIQSAKLKEAEIEIARLQSQVELSAQIRRADEAAYEAQIKLIREASRYAQEQKRNLNELDGLDDDAWVRGVLDSLWLKDSPATDGSAKATGVDVREMPGAADARGNEKRKDSARVRKSNN